MGGGGEVVRNRKKLKTTVGSGQGKWFLVLTGKKKKTGSHTKIRTMSTESSIKTPVAGRKEIVTDARKNWRGKGQGGEKNTTRHT